MAQTPKAQPPRRLASFQRPATPCVPSSDGNAKTSFRRSASATVTAVVSAASSASRRWFSPQASNRRRRSPEKEATPLLTGLGTESVTQAGAQEAEEDEGPEGRDDEDEDEAWARRLQEEFDGEAAAKAERTRFQCPLCLEVSTFDESIELDCSHRSCSSCFSAYLEVKIKEKCITEEELCCPMPGCGLAITVPQVEGATKGTPLWDRFLAARADLWQPEPSQDERLCTCPMPKCATRFLVAADLGQVWCPQCRTRFCAKCGEAHLGSCEDFAAWQRGNDAAEQAFESLVKQEGWQRCPHCGAACERQVGCNFMTCHSEVCRGKNTFCYLCGCRLTKSQHFSHFPEGVFENVCQNVDRRQDSSIPQTQWQGVGAGLRDIVAGLGADLGLRI